jgi:hypothetical protein
MRRSRNHEAAEEFGASNAGLEDATPHEEMMLLAASGVTILQLHAALGGPMAMEGMEPSHPPDRAAIENVRARIRRRRRLGLPHVDCLTTDCSCGSLASALDELDENATKAKIHRATRRTHKARNPVFAPVPMPSVQSEPPVARDKPVTPPARIPEAVTQTNTKPFLVVKKRKRWYDDDRGGGGIMDRRF